MSDKEIHQIIEILKNGGVGILPTDTIYGLVGSALKAGATERIYKIKGRKTDKPFIILISSVKDIKYFGINVKEYKKIFNKYWPGPVSIILPVIDSRFEYLHRGTGSIAFRLPKSDFLQRLIKETGPLVAPSANPEGYDPAKKIKEAKEYFGDKIDFYFDAGRIEGVPSKIIKIENGKEVIIRG